MCFTCSQCCTLPCVSEIYDWRCSQARDLEYESSSRRLQEATSRVIVMHRSLDDANTQARADAEEAERLRGQLRSAAEARDAAVQERDAAKGEREATVRERDAAVQAFKVSTPPPSLLRARGESATQHAGSSKAKLLPCSLCSSRGLVLGIRSLFLALAALRRCPR